MVTPARYARSKSAMGWEADETGRVPDDAYAPTTVLRDGGPGVKPKARSQTSPSPRHGSDRYRRPARRRNRQMTNPSKPIGMPRGIRLHKMRRPLAAPVADSALLP